MAPNSELNEASLLSPEVYDDDASSAHSERSGLDSDSEDDEMIRGRTSSEIRQHDQAVLEDEEETNDLLEQSRRQRGRKGSANPLQNMFAKHSVANLKLPLEEYASSEKSGYDEKRGERRTRREAKKEKLLSEASNGEDRSLMYEMEEGGLKEGSSTGESSDTEENDERDARRLRSLLDEKAQRRKQWKKFFLFGMLIALGISVLILAALKLSTVRLQRQVKAQEYISNGTALFAPTTILISLDGFRADFLKRGITPRLNAMIAEGVSPDYMLPSFPSVTFPNHYTLVTGLYPESHGVVGNTFWDTNIKAEFFYTDPSRSMQSTWWSGEPLWVSAERQGIRSAIHMWPGSEAHILGIEPSFLDKYNGSEILSKKVDRILELLDKPGQEHESAAIDSMRPQLIAAYVPNVDADGHLYGPNSTEIRKTISEVDTMLDHLFNGLEERNLTSIVNVVVVSDHGMATTSTDRLIQLEDLIDPDKISHIDGWPLYGLRPKDLADLQGLYDKLVSEAAVNPNFEVYLRDVNMPERYHFSNNERIAPLWIVPKTGWAIVTKEEFNVKEAKGQGKAYHPMGLHGYDHEHPLMRAIFIAKGPAFPHKPNSRVAAFRKSSLQCDTTALPKALIDHRTENIEVYNIICGSLNLTPNPNNGTLSLPLQTIGVHTPETSPPEPADPVPSEIIAPAENSTAANNSLKIPPVVGVESPDAVDRPAVHDDNTDNTTKEKISEEAAKLLDYINGKLGELKAWAAGVMGGKEGEADGSEMANIKGKEGE